MDSPSTRRKTSVHFEPSRITRYAVIEYRYGEVRSTDPSKKGAYGHTAPADRFPDKASQAARSPACRAAPPITTYSAQGPMFKSNRTEPPTRPRFRAILARLRRLSLEQARHLDRAIAVYRPF